MYHIQRQFQHSVYARVLPHFWRPNARYPANDMVGRLRHLIHRYRPATAVNNGVQDRRVSARIIRTMLYNTHCDPTELIDNSLAMLVDLRLSETTEY